MLQAAEGVVTARSHVNELAESLGKAGEHVGGLRETNMAIREIANGDITRLPFTFTKLSQEFAGLGIKGLGAVAGVAALGAGLFELASMQTKLNRLSCRQPPPSRLIKCRRLLRRWSQ
jgi:hypothetical protein